MKPEFELELDSDGGTIRTIYQDGVESFAEELGAEVSSVCRASTVEWEEVGPTMKGWVVRSVRDPVLALRGHLAAMVYDENVVEVRCSRNTDVPIMVFPTRELALELEVKFFWNLMHGKES